MSTSVLKRRKIAKVQIGHAEGYAARNYNFVFSSEISDWMCGVGYSYGVLKRKKRYGTIHEESEPTDKPATIGSGKIIER